MAGLFDNFQFDPNSFDAGGLLAQLRTQLQGNQSSPLDNAQWPAGPQGNYGQTQNVAVGDYQMPVFGRAPQPDPAAIPQNAQLAQFRPQQTAPAPSPAEASPGFLDRLGAGLGGFAGANGPLDAIGNLVGGLATGQRQDSRGIAQQSQKAIYEAVLQQPGMTRQKAFIIATNPKAFEAYSAQLFDNNKYGFTTLPDGTIVRQDPRTGEVAPAYQGQPKADWGVVSEADGQKTYGWIDKNKRTVVPVGPAEPQKETITGPDGKQIAIPPGVDRKTFINEVSRAGAKAAAGEKTEVQAKSEKFGNKMELAERNLQGLENEGTGYLARSLDGLPLVGGSAATNYFQSENYQKYRQGRDNFITALLRDESGAAIGTEEFKRYEKELFPQPGDAPGVIRQKAEARRIAIEAMKKSAGPGYKSPEIPSATGGSPKVDDLLKKYGS